MSDLEQKIRGAAEKAIKREEWPNYVDANDWVNVASPDNILALLAEKDAEIERLRGLIVPGDGSCDRCGKMPAIVMPTSLCDECIAGLKRAESAERERDEWKRIADRYRMNSHHSCAVWHPGPCDNRCGICKAYDVLAGKGE